MTPFPLLSSHDGYTDAAETMPDGLFVSDFISSQKNLPRRQILHTQNYSVGEPIGNGCSSTVYLASCKRGRLRGRVVALKKVCSPTVTICCSRLLTRSLQVSLSIVALESLTDSSTLHQSLYHPSIVSLHSFFSTPSAHYHVLEYCSRGTIQDVLLSRSPPVLTEPEIRGILRGVVSALVYLRNECILHRDLKPGNVLINEDSRVVSSPHSLITTKSSPIVFSETVRLRSRLPTSWSEGHR